MKKIKNNDWQIPCAKDWGIAIGRIRRNNSLPKGTAKGTYLKGEPRLAFEQGLSIGFGG